MELKIRDAISRFLVELAESGGEVSTIVLDKKTHKRLSKELCSIQRYGVGGPATPSSRIEIAYNGVEIRPPALDTRLLNLARKYSDEL